MEHAEKRGNDMSCGNCQENADAASVAVFTSKEGRQEGLSRTKKFPTLYKFQFCGIIIKKSK